MRIPTTDPAMPPRPQHGRRIRLSQLERDPMNDRNAYWNHIAAVHGESGGALFACGLWLRIGFVGACVALAGIVALFGGDGTPLSALTLAAGGVALAVFGWRRAYAAVDVIERHEADAAEATSPSVRTAGA